MNAVDGVEAEQRRQVLDEAAAFNVRVRRRACLKVASKADKGGAANGGAAGQP